MPEIDRQQAQGRRVAFRADAAFARPAIYEALEARGVGYAIRIPANKKLELAIEDVLFRSPGRPKWKSRPISGNWCGARKADGSPWPRIVAARLGSHSRDTAEPWAGSDQRPDVIFADHRGSRFEALEPIRQGVRERFGAIGEGVARGLRLRHDHGSNYLADDFQQEVAFFGIESSPSFVREPEGNGVAERFIRTLKENLLGVRSFDTIETLRLALLEFKRTYTEQWMLEKYHYRSPAQVRRDLVRLDAAA